MWIFDENMVGWCSGYHVRFTMAHRKVLRVYAAGREFNPRTDHLLPVRGLDL